MLKNHKRLYLLALTLLLIPWVSFISGQSVQAATTIATQTFTVYNKHNSSSWYTSSGSKSFGPYDLTDYSNVSVSISGSYLSSNVWSAPVSSSYSWSGSTSARTLTVDYSFKTRNHWYEDNPSAGQQYMGVRYTVTVTGTKATAPTPTPTPTSTPTPTPTPTYTIKFANWDGNIISSRSYTRGSRITIPADPTKPSDDTYDYTFSGWSPAVSTTAYSSVTYIATYTASLPKYTIKFVNWDGSIIASNEYTKGSTVSIPENPTKPSDDLYNYTFSGWTPAVDSTAQASVTYIATYTPSLISTLKIKDEFALQNTIEHGAMYAIGNAWFYDETDPKAEYKWEMLINDGNGHTSPEDFVDIQTMILNDPADSQVINLSDYNTTEQEKAINGHYALNSIDSDGYPANTISINDNGQNGIKNSQLEISHLILDDKDANGRTLSLNGCFFRYGVKNSESEDWLYSNWAKLNVDNVNRFYPYTEKIDNTAVNSINWKYRLDRNGEIEALYTEDKDLSAIIDQYGILHIPSTVNGIVVRGIGGGTKDTTFVPVDVQSGFTSLDVPNTISTIQDYAFSGVGMKRISEDVYATDADGNYIPNKNEAGADIPVLINVEIPANVKNVGREAFAHSLITTVKTRGGNLNEKAFADCHNLTTVELYTDNNSTNTIGNGCFMNSGIQTIRFGNSEWKLEENAFANNADLRSVYIPENVTLGVNAYNNCSGLNTVQIDTAEVPSNAFANCALKTIMLEENVESVTSDWAGQNTGIENNAVFRVKNNDTKFEGKQAISPFGASGNTAYINYVQDEENATFDFAIGATGTHYGTCYAIDCSNDANDEHKPYYTANNTVTLIFHNGGTLQKREGETDEEFEARQTKNDGYTDPTTGTGNMEDVYAGISDDELEGIIASCDRTIFVGVDADGKIVSFPLYYNDITVQEKNTGRPYIGEYYVLREIGTEDSEYDYGDFFDMMNGDGDTPGLKDKKNAENEPADIYDDTRAELEFHNAKSLQATMSDITNGDKYGSFDAYVIAPNHITADTANRGAYIAEFKVSVQKYIAADVINQKYKSYDEIVKAITELEDALRTANSDIEQYQLMIQKVTEILNNNPDLLDENGDIDKEALAEKIRQLTTEYNALTDEEKAGPAGTALKNEIDAMQAMLAKGDYIEDLLQQISEKQAEADGLKAQYDHVMEEFDDFCEQFDTALIGFTQTTNTIDGKINKYTVFINDHQYVYYPTETVNETVEGADLLTKPIITAHVDPEVEPNAPDLDGNDDGKFRFFQSMGVCYILKPDQNAVYTTYTKELVESIQDAKGRLTAINTRLTDIDSELSKINTSAADMITALNNAGYQLDLDDDATMSEQAEKIDEKLKQLIKDYADVRALLTGDETADPAAAKAKLEELLAEIDALKASLQNEQTNSSNKDQNILSLTNDLDALRKQIADKNQEITDKNQQIADRDQQITDKNQEITNKNQQITDKDQEISDKDKEISNKTAELNAKNNALADKDAELAGKEKELSQKNAALAAKDQDIEDYKKMIASLNNKISELEKKASSGSMSSKDLLAALSAISKQVEELKNVYGSDDLRNIENSINGLRNDIDRIDTGSGSPTDLSGVLTQLSAIKGTVSALQAQPVQQMTTGGGIRYVSTNNGTSNTTETNTEKDLTQSVHKHNWEYTDNKDGKTHTRKCKTCKETFKNEAHVYNEETGKCDCGAKKENAIVDKQSRELEQLNCEHEWKYTDNKDESTHVKICQKCGLEKQEFHVYDQKGDNENEKKCLCGSTQKIEKTVVEKKTEKITPTPTPLPTATPTPTTTPVPLITEKTTASEDLIKAEETEEPEVAEETVEEEEEKKLPLWVWLAGIAGALLIVLIIVIVNAKRKHDMYNGEESEDQEFMSSDEESEEGSGEEPVEENEPDDLKDTGEQMEDFTDDDDIMDDNEI